MDTQESLPDLALFLLLPCVSLCPGSARVLARMRRPSRESWSPGVRSICSTSGGSSLRNTTSLSTKPLRWEEGLGVSGEGGEGQSPEHKIQSKIPTVFFSVSYYYLLEQPGCCWMKGDLPHCLYPNWFQTDQRFIMKDFQIKQEPIFFLAFKKLSLKYNLTHHQIPLFKGII